ncbi:MAG TPA: hypothetical protein DCQ26_16185 [Marinilabiliales bacterium]|jgi:hypothetical protein|nr:MAG: hypothetical protein A2W95_19430 [Bacteroidetes bacterium GWA2_40_14]OFX57351.1 MAG: hypothetical protein A2W84_00430 [Bacteroidetes bacterium GWC2_40_13]OFX76198.1 MAG: hypothetical protein A2W96_00425 [Bacteroidetes bacterium GWD2_40_43]OFX95353.1 MAG: hypothetical protein A2W97_07260 [Bacteroidetes bacterium GWE2_40_63]OFZ24001.1 MAG: hypothetical protein A2437_06180 [Bacteroidetes bacterium RIFOXYC2_FULL_40_12]HAN00139.1 hypothetical protein [Marinilabiliales bacterium]
MKLKIYIIIIFGILVSSCTSNFEEINENPNYPATTDAAYLFNYVTKEGAGEYGIITSYNYTYIQSWIMQTSAVWGNSTMPPYTLFDQYRINLLWEYYYSDLLLNCTALELLTSENPEDVNKYQVARIWKVFNFHKVTDLWGDVPYSKAWKALTDYSAEALKPAYDTQEDIYTTMLAILDEAAKGIDLSKPFYSNDMIFDGDLDKWIKFANSLRLRLAIRSGNEAVVSGIIIQNNLISTNEESAMFSYITSQEWWNPYYDLWIDSKESTPKISELLKLQLESTGDPRLPIYARPIELDNTTIKGVPNLMDANKKENQALGMGVTSTSYIGAYFTENATLSKPLLTYAEVCFSRAEAAFRGWTADNAQTWYENGVRASMSSYGITEATISTFLAGGGLFNNTLEQIMVQKWISLYLNGWEAYAEYRRTGYPQLKKYDLVLDGIKIKEIDWVDVPREYVPGRLPYPDKELKLNEENYLKAVEQIGGDSYYQQVWWGKKFGTVNY